MFSDILNCKVMAYIKLLNYTRGLEITNLSGRTGRWDFIIIIDAFLGTVSLRK